MELEYVMEAKNVSKGFNGRIILDNVSINVEKGATIGIIGQNGSGKSLLFKIMVGLLRPDQGEVSVRGMKLGKNSDFPENMGILINSPGYIELYTGLENLQFLAAINHRITTEVIIATMKMVGLNLDDKTKVKNYSMGMKQKLGLAQAIMENQDIIILDEPFNALDYQTNNDIKAIIKNLQKEQRTILITSHNFQDIEELCSEVYIINNAHLEKLTDEMKKYYSNRTE